MDALQGNIWHSDEAGDSHIYFAFTYLEYQWFCFLVYHFPLPLLRIAELNTPPKPLKQITILTMIDFFTTFTGIAYVNGQTVLPLRRIICIYTTT